MKLNTPTCRSCGCTEHDCLRCIEKTGRACSWVEPDLCSACIRKPASATCHFYPEHDQERKFTMSFVTDLDPGNEDLQLRQICDQALKSMGLKNMIITRTQHNYNQLFIKQ